MRMSSYKRVLSLTAVLLLIITVSAIYIHQNDPQTKENIRLFNIKQTLGTPIDAEFLSIKQYDLLDQSITVYTWRQKNTLYEAQLDERGSIIKATTYQHNTNETNITMTPALAETLAQQKLITETQYPPGHPNLSKPKFDYYTYRPKGPNWVVSWGLHSGNYTISNVGFEVIVYTETGETVVENNEFDEVTEIPAFDPPTVSSEEAEQLAAGYFKEYMEYASAESTRVHSIRISPPDDFFIRQPYRLYWSVSVQGMGLLGGVPTRITPVFLIDAYTGELLSSFHISIGWDAINWESRSYPYYGSIYPKIIDNTPQGYDFPLSIEEVKEQLSNHSALYRSNINGTFRIRVYDETSISNSLSWDTIIVEIIENRPVIASYWSASNNWIKTGLIKPPDSIRSFVNADSLIDGLFIVIDPITGELTHFYNSTRVNPPTNTLNITREQAINITATSPITDPKNKIIAPESLRLAEPRIIKPDWISQLAHIGDYSRLYIAEGNQSEPRIYWLIEYVSYPEVHGGYTGTYLVDAETGQLALALEDQPLPDLMFRGNAPEHITLKRGETTAFNITVTAAPTLEAQLPVTLTADRIPAGVTATIQRDTHQLSNQKPAVFKITLTVSTDAPIGSYDTGFSIQLLGTRTSVYTELEVTP